MKTWITTPSWGFLSNFNGFMNLPLNILIVLDFYGDITSLVVYLNKNFQYFFYKYLELVSTHKSATMYFIFLLLLCSQTTFGQDSTVSPTAPAGFIEGITSFFQSLLAMLGQMVNIISQQVSTSSSDPSAPNITETTTNLNTTRK